MAQVLWEHRLIIPACMSVLDHGSTKIVYDSGQADYYKDCMVSAIDAVN